MENKTHRSWTFVLWNHDERPPFQADKVKYAIYQQEEVPRGKHWQGYFTAKQPIRMTAAKAIVGVNHVHVEPAGGTAEQNRKYCTKTADDCANNADWADKGGRVPGTDIIEIGTLKSVGQGKRQVNTGGLGLMTWT